MGAPTTICWQTDCVNNVFIESEPPERQYQCGATEIEVEPCAGVFPTCRTYAPI